MGWSDATMEDLKNVEGWARTRTYKCVDNLKSGMGVGSSKEEQKVPGYLVIHGEQASFSVYQSIDYWSSEEFLHPAVPSPSQFKLSLQKHSEKFYVQFVSDEERRWGLYRAYPGIAQAQQWGNGLGEPCVTGIVYSGSSLHGAVDNYGTRIGIKIKWVHPCVTNSQTKCKLAANMRNVRCLRTCFEMEYWCGEKGEEPTRC